MLRQYWVQVNFCQKLLFLHQLLPTHNLTTDCSLNLFNTWKFQAQNMGRTCCVHKLFFVFVLTFRTIYVHNMFWERSKLAIFMYWTCNSMNNLLSHCGLVDARISASEKDLPVLQWLPKSPCLKFGSRYLCWLLCGLVRYLSFGWSWTCKH